GGDAGCRLVEQNDLRIERERGGDVEQLLLALGERRGGCVQPAIETEDARHFARAGADRRVGGKAREQMPALALARDERGCDGLLDGELRKDRNELKRACESLLGKFDRTDAGDALSPKQNVAGRGLKEPGEQVDQGRLAGAVRPDGGDELVGGNSDADVLQRAEFAESFADPAGLEESAHASAR